MFYGKMVCIRATGPVWLLAGRNKSGAIIFGAGVVPAAFGSSGADRSRAKLRQPSSRYVVIS